MSEFYPYSTKNILLRRDEVGKGKMIPREIPFVEQGFGKPAPKDPEGAKEVLHHWRFHSRSKERSPGKDFKNLNRLSVVNGAANSKEFSRYRKNQNVLLPHHRPTLSLKTVLPEESFSYGLPNRPSTPIRSVLSHEYGVKASQIVQEMYRTRNDSISVSMKLQLPKLTKSVKLVQEQTSKKLYGFDTESVKQPFKMKQFLRVESKIDDINDKYIPPKQNSISVKGNRSVTLEGRHSHIGQHGDL